MPEGDTLHRVATRLRPALEGRTLERFEALRLAGDRPRRGETIVSVESVGKYLLIAFSGGLTLATHLRMTGSWHLYRVGERWRKPAHLARAVVATDEWVAVCFSAPVVRTYPTASPGASPVDHLGPDLCRPDADIDEAVRRFATHADPDTSIGDALLDQRIAAGIGNVYRCEVLWACRLHHDTPVRDVSVPARRELLVTAARLLKANLGGGERRTVPGGLAVYDRARRPCRQCQTPIEVGRTGRDGRIVYWCPRCQVSAAAM
ncbi:MAG: DNA-formamidopyrimidine glycosylase family protein [Acidimicrobiales bacterium]